MEKLHRDLGNGAFGTGHAGGNGFLFPTTGYTALWGNTSLSDILISLFVPNFASIRIFGILSGSSDKA